MTRTENTDGGYTLTADTGKDLAVYDLDGVTVLVRTKEVSIPSAGTLNVWVEVTEEVPQPVDSAAEKDTRIAELKAELARLETN